MPVIRKDLTVFNDHVEEAGDDLCIGSFCFSKDSRGYLTLHGRLAMGGETIYLPSMYDYGSTPGDPHANTKILDADLETIRNIANFIRRYLDAAITLRAMVDARDNEKKETA